MLQTKLIKGVENVAKVLFAVSQKARVAVESLEIKIENFETYAKKPGEDFFKIIDDEVRDDDALFESQECEFKQTYDIVVYEREHESSFEIKILNNFESVELVLKPNFVVPKNEAEFRDFVDKINALKVKNGVFLRDLEKESNIIKDEMSNFINRELTITLCKAKTFRDSRDSRLVFSHKEVDISKKNIICVKQNATICEFYFAKNGISGRNLAGIYTEANELTSTPPTFSSDIKETQNHLYNAYTSIESGFVIFENNNFSFNTELQFKNIQVRDNYHFSGDIDSKTHLIISSDNEFEDSIKEGVQIKANKITINGNIAANTIIEASELEITGQTHKSTKLIAQNAKISVHKGNLNAKNATIANLEGGNIQSENLQIAKANGGILESKNIAIKELYSNATIRFSDKCTIDSIKGGGNKITITPLALKSNRDIKDKLDKEIESINAQEKALNAKTNHLVAQYNKYQNTARGLKETIQNDKKNGKETPQYIINNYHSFLQIVESIKQAKAQNLQIEKDKNAKLEEFKDLDKSILKAEFICKDGWLKYNDLILESIADKKDIAQTIIKGAGRYYLKNGEIIQEKIFTNSDETIDNQGF